MGEFFKLNRNIQLRILMVFMSVLIGSSVGPNMTIYYVDYFGAFWTGLLLIVVQIAGFFAGLYGGHVADTWGRKKVMTIGVATIVLGYVLAAVMNSPLLVSPQATFFGFLLVTVGYGFADPAEEAMLIDMSSPKNRQFIYSMIYWVLNVGVMIGAAIGGWFFKTHRFELMTGTAIVAAINLIIIIIWITETLPQEARSQHGDSLGAVVKSYRGVMVDKRFMLFSAGLVLSTAVFSQPDFYLAAHLGQSFHTITLAGLTIFGQRMLSLITIENTFLIIVLMGVMTKLTQRFSLKNGVVIGTLVQSGGFALAFIFNTFWPLLIAGVILTFGEMIVTPASQTLRADMMNPAKIGAYSGFSAATRPVGTILAASVVSASHFIGNIGAAVLIIMAGLGAVAFMLAAIKRLPATISGK
ncbi:MFS transporter [Periweissella cryptocerci]|uniref:MFS transporter n=1 Tax=Periweissella cryptocerci TaxID=2506420 RepID=A0A4P6YUM4_9LACO|nr:MFS transporter [Periweissella cryptocerci]QBO36450.1 MFS transporter [Periweissella cryptocerci]